MCYTFTMHLNGLDWLIVALFFALMFGIAAVCSRRAGKSAKEFFLSGRSMPWWLIGFSMAAAATSSNSASMFTEFVREGGMSRMWKWWAFLLTGMTTVFIYSKLWVRSGAKSDIEFYELRYSGRAASFLRGFRAIYLGLVFNAITTAWCILPAVKMGQVLFNVDQWTIIWVCCASSIIYSALGGFRGAIITDFFLFLIILAGAFAIMYFGWSHPAVGGFSAMMENPAVKSHLAFFPDFADTDTLVAVFIIPVAVQWWNVWYPGSEPGGGGYIVHRMLSAKNENHCQAGTILFLVMNYVVRPWPWYLAAFATLVIFPDLESLKAMFPHIPEEMVKGDLAYPALFRFIPSGWLGLVVASMLGALFSTVAAHLSMGSNYIANDFWKRFVRKDAGERELVVVGRVSVVVLMLASAFLTNMVASVGAFFNLILQIGAGTGLIYLLRWFWMRINAWSEITAMTVSFVVAVYLQLAHPEMLAWQRLVVVMAITTAAGVAVAFVTPMTDGARLAAFRSRVRAGRSEIGWGLVCVSLGALAVYSLMFGVGCWVYGQWMRASLLTVVAAAAVSVLVPIVRRKLNAPQKGLDPK